MMTTIQALRYSRDFHTEKLVKLQDKYEKERDELLTEINNLTAMIDNYLKSNAETSQQYTSMHTSLQGRE